jgi:hypothetical protein
MQNEKLVSLVWALSIAGCGGPAMPDTEGSDGGNIRAPNDGALAIRDGGLELDATRTLADCGALGPAGDVAEITPPGFTGEGVSTVIVDPFVSGRVYLGTAYGGIHRSDDCGATWTKVNVGENGEILDTGINWILVASPDEPGVLYANAFEGSELGILKSTNGGRDWEVTDDYWAQSLSMDPNDSRHLLQTIHDDCGCMRESVDGAETWRTVPLDAGFTEGAGPVLLGPSRWLFALRGEGSFLTEDGGEGWRMVTSGGGGQVYWADDGALYLGGLFGAVRSRDGGRTFEDLPGLPRSLALASDGSRIWGGYVWNEEAEAIYVSDEMGEGASRQISLPRGAGNPANLAYDEGHRLLYSANGHEGGGAWRIVID